MFFESRVEPLPSTSTTFAAARTAFLEGRVREAAALAPARAVVAGDALLAIDIWRAHGLSHRGGAVARASLKQFDSPLLVLEASSAFASRHRLRAADAVLERAAGIDDQLLQARVLSRRAIHASLRGLLDDAASFSRAADALADDDAIVQYGLAWAAEQRRDWDLALVHARRLEALAPRWWRASISLVEILLSRGQTAEADAVLARAIGSRDEDANIEVVAALVELSRASPDRACRRLTAMGERWPRMGRAPTHNALRAIAARLANRPDDVASAAAAVTDEDLRRRLRSPAGPVRFLAAPRLAQRRNMCFPTAVAIAADTQGIHLDVTVLAEQMESWHGTEAFRGWRALRGLGWRIEHVHSTLDVVRGVLDQRLPLLGLLDGIGAGHIETIIGLDDNAGLVFVRDPARWQPQLYAAEALGSRYGGGGTLVVAVPPGAKVTIEESWRAPEAVALDVLAQHVADGDRVAAERAFARITSAQARAHAERLAVGVVITPSALLAAERRRVDDVDTPPIVRARALLALADSGDGADDASPSRNDDDDDTAAVTGPFAAILRARHLLGTADAEGALAVLDAANDVLTETIEYWSIRVDALAACGDLDGARRALTTALQLEPTSPELRRRQRLVAEAGRGAVERLAALDAEQARAPQGVALLQERAMALLDVGDGDGALRAFERLCAMRPRWPHAWALLIGFLHEQERGDLIDEALAKARPLLGADADGLDPRAEPAVGPRGDASSDAVGERAAAAVRAAVRAVHTRHDTADALVALDAALQESLPTVQHAQLTAWEVAVAAADPHTAPVDAVTAVVERRQIAARGPLWLQVFFQLVLDLTPRGSGPLLAIPIADGVNTRRLRLLRAQLLLRTGRVVEARAALQALAIEDPQLPGLAAALSHAAIAVGDLVEARRRAELALVEEPGDIDARALACRLAWANGDPVAGLAHQRLWFRARPLMRSTLLDTVLRVDEQEGRDAANAIIDAAVGHTAAVRTLARCLIAARRNDKDAPHQIDALDAAAIVDDGTARATWRLQIELAADRDDVERCEAIVARARQRFPDDASFVAWQTRLQRHRRQPRAAATTAREALLRGVLSPDLIEPFLLDNEAGFGVITMLNAAAPSLRRSLTVLAVSSLPATIERSALKQIEALIQTSYPADTDIGLAFANLLVRLGDAARARAILAPLRRGDPTDIELAVAEAALLPVDKALDARRAIAEQNGAASSWADVAIAAAAAVNIVAASAAYEAAVAVDPCVPAVLGARVALGGGFGTPVSDDDADDAAAAAALDSIVDDGGATPWLHLAAIEAALAIGDSVPEAWLSGAWARCQAITPARTSLERSEAARLQIAVAAWCDAAGEKYPEGLVLERHLARSDWPGRRWLPPRLRLAPPLRPRRGGHRPAVTTNTSTTTTTKATTTSSTTPTSSASTPASLLSLAERVQTIGNGRLFAAAGIVLAIIVLVVALTKLKAHAAEVEAEAAAAAAAAAAATAVPPDPVRGVGVVYRRGADGCRIDVAIVGDLPPGATFQLRARANGRGEMQPTGLPAKTTGTSTTLTLLGRVACGRFQSFGVAMTSEPAGDLVRGAVAFDEVQVFGSRGAVLLSEDAHFLRGLLGDADNVQAQGR